MTHEFDGCPLMDGECSCDVSAEEAAALPPVLTAPVGARITGLDTPYSRAEEARAAAPKPRVTAVYSVDVCFRHWVPDAHGNLAPFHGTREQPSCQECAASGEGFFLDLSAKAGTQLTMSPEAMTIQVTDDDARKFIEDHARRHASDYVCIECHERREGCEVRLWGECHDQNLDPSEWHPMSWYSGRVKRCDQHAKPKRPWVADLSVGAVRDYLQREYAKHHDYAFVINFDELEKMRPRGAGGGGFEFL